MTPTERTTVKGVIAPGQVAAVRFTINGVYNGETRIQLEHVNRIGRDAAAAGCLATGLRALNAVPSVNDLPPGWVTPLDLPLIAGRGTIR